MSAKAQPSKRARLICAAVVFAISLSLYVRTLAPTVTLVDSGELIVAARTLGVAHPPGFPLYLLLAHAATLMPVGNVAVRVNLASAFFAAIAAAMLVLTVAEALAMRHTYASDCKRLPQKGKRNPKDLSAGLGGSALTLLPALASGLLLAFARTLWSYATIAEVYTLNSLLTLIIFFLMFRWRRKALDARREVKQKPLHHQYGLLYTAAFVFGLALGVHHVTIGLALPAYAALVYFTEGAGFFKSRRLIHAALFAFAGLAIYAYLPISASRRPVLNWGDPRTLQRLWWHVSGRQYQVFFSFLPEQMAGRISELIKLVGREFGPWWLPVGLALSILGYATLLKTDRVMFGFLSLVVVADLLYSLNYEIAEDKDAYYLPIFITAAIAAGFGAQRVVHFIGTRRLQYAPALATAALLVAPAVALASNLPFNNRSRYFIAEDYIENILSTVEPQGLLLTLDWQVYSPMLYARHIEQRRHDVIAIDVNLLRRVWYYDYLKREYPELIDQTSDRVEAFLEDLRQWEQDPKAYDRDARLNQRINARFYEMISALVSNHIQRGSVYVTQDIATGQDEELARRLAAAYQLVPQGLVFQLFRDSAYHDPAEPQLSMRGLVDGSLKFEPDDVVRIKILPVYLSMLVNRGRYLAAHDRHQRATQLYRQALAIKEDYLPAQQALTESLNVLRGTKAKFQ
jgi:hypothetical protein